MFLLSQKQIEKLKEWKKEQDQKVIDSQKETEFGYDNLPYYGAIEGGYTYEFTPTGLGCVIKVKNNMTNEVIDLTEYDLW